MISVLLLLFFISKYFLVLLLLFLCSSLLSFLADTRASEGSGRAGSCGSPEISPFSRSPLNAAVNTLAVLVIRLQLLLLLLVRIYHQTTFISRVQLIVFISGKKSKKKKRKKESIFGHFLQT